jgi:hypothetical protein
MNSSSTYLIPIFKTFSYKFNINKLIWKWKYYNNSTKCKYIIVTNDIKWHNNNNKKPEEINKRITTSIFYEQ